MSHRSRTGILPLLALLSSTVGAADPPQPVITLAGSIPFAPDAAGDVGISASRGGNAQHFETQCDLQRSLAREIAAQAQRKGVNVVLSPDAADATGPVLHVTIEGVMGMTGMWKGPKSLTLRGELRDGDQVLGSFVARSQETGLFKNSCEEFIAAGAKAARDIAKWLRKPTLKARLGEA